MIFLSALILNNILLFASSFSHLKSYTFVQTPKKYKMWRAQCLTQIKWKLMLLLITVGSSNLEQYALYIFCWNIDIKTNRMYSCWQLFETNNFNYSSKNSLFVCLFVLYLFFFLLLLPLLLQLSLLLLQLMLMLIIKWVKFLAVSIEYKSRNKTHQNRNNEFCK